MAHRTEKKTFNNYDTFQVNNEKRLTYISLFDGLSCNQSFSQKQTQTKIKRKKSL